MVQCSTKIKKKLPDKWGTTDCKIKTIYIREYFKVDDASYLETVGLQQKIKYLL